MWDWLEDSAYLKHTAIGASLALLLVPLGAWYLHPAMFVLAMLFYFACLSAVWSYVLSPQPYLYMNIREGLAEPKGWAALMVRLRLTLFGTATTTVLVCLYVQLAEMELRSGVPMVFALALGAASVASFFSVQVTVLLLTVWRFLYSMVFDGISIWHGLTKDHKAQVAALKALDARESAFFGMIAGYEANVTFRTEAEVLRSNIPPISFKG